MDRALRPIANVRGGDGKAALGTSEKKLYPKESALIDPVAAGRMEGRRVLVYATHTGTKGITGRMDDILTRHGSGRLPRDARSTQPGQAGVMSYRNTLQADALKLVAEELRSALAVGGDPPEDWLATFGDGGSDLLMALVRSP